MIGRFRGPKQVHQEPDDWALGGEGGDPDTATAETRPLMSRERHKRQKRRGKSTKARGWGGSASKEGPVKGLVRSEGAGSGGRRMTMTNTTNRSFMIENAV
jgi:hypothetical protein